MLVLTGEAIVYDGAGHGYGDRLIAAQGSLPNVASSAIVDAGLLN